MGYIFYPIPTSAKLIKLIIRSLIVCLHDRLMPQNTTTELIQTVINMIRILIARTVVFPSQTSDQSLFELVKFLRGGDVLENAYYMYD